MWPIDEAIKIDLLNNKDFAPHHYMGVSIILRKQLNIK